MIKYNFNNMTEQNNMSHWCKAVIEEAVHTAPLSSQPSSTWNYQLSQTNQIPSTFTNNLSSIQLHGYGGVVSATPMTHSLIQQAYSSIPNNGLTGQPPQSSYSQYGYPAQSSMNYYGNLSVPTNNNITTNINTVTAAPMPTPPTSIAYSSIAPQYSYPIIPSNYSVSNQNTQSLPSAPTTATTTIINQPSMNQQVIYQMPHLNLSLASGVIPPATISTVPTTKKPNPSRFTATVSTPTTIETENMNNQTKSTKSSSVDGVPESLKNFIKRALATCNTPQEREYMQATLGKLVTKVRNDQRLAIHKWELEPIPTLPSEITGKITAISQPTVMTTSENGNMGDVNSKTETKKRKSRWEPDSNGNISIRNGNMNGNSNNTVSNDSNSNISSDSGNNTFAVSNTNKKNKTIAQSIATSSSSIVKPDNTLTPEDMMIRQQRASRFQYDATHSSSSSSSQTVSYIVDSSKKKSKNKQNNQQAVDHYKPSESYEEFDLESLKIVGTCQVLEKDYFRLTSAPDPSTVRPLDILKKSLQLIKKKWKNGGVEYIYICSQLKAVRQDLTVQNIRNEFMVEVYEIHARIALECGDLNEYNQCQTQLKQLYDTGLPGSEMEFTAYRILYYVYLQGNKKYQKGSSDLSGILATLSENAKRNSAVGHALLVRQAIRRENYHKFFQLYKITPNMGSYILDQMLDGLRLQVLYRMCKAYKPHIPLLWTINELGFDNIDTGKSFLIKAGCILSDIQSVIQDSRDIATTETVIMTAESVIDPSAVLTQDKLLL